MSALDEYPLGDIKFQAAMILAGVRYKGPKIEKAKAIKEKPDLVTIPPLENGEIPTQEYRNCIPWSQKKQVIVSAVCRIFNINQRDALGPDRLRINVRTRAIIYHIFQTRLNMSTPQIGHHFSRDHTSILCGLTNFKKDKWGDNYKMIAINAELDILFGISKPSLATFSADEFLKMCPPCGIIEAAE